MPLSKQEFAEVLRRLPADADQETVNKAADAAEAGTPLSKVWDFVNRPLVGAENSFFLQHKHSADESGVRRVAEDLGASLTSPISLATGAAGVGASVAGAKGALGISKGARAVEAGLQAPFVAEGLHKVVSGDSAGEKLAGGVEAALGAHGVSRAATHAFPPGKVVETYMGEKNFSRLPREPFDPKEAMKTGDAYEQMQHLPNDPEVAASYKSLQDEIKQQYLFLKNRAGLNMEPFDAAKFDVDNYPNSEAMQADVNKNNHLHFYPTDTGFGSNPDVKFADHPMLQKDPETGMTYNDMFRAVHDYFGHAAEGSTFK